MKKCSLAKIVFIIITLVCGISAQSTNVDFPTPVTRDEVRGKIAARDIGDSRLTTHYYVFEGRQGDIFINIEANNLDGDVDIFLAENLKPLTKVNLYADSGLTQTGRELYLRKPEKLILRVQGRTPGDDPATYAIKFSGSFQAVSAKSTVAEPKLPVIKSETEGEVKVNSVGTIIASKPKPTPAPKETVAKTSNNRNNVKTTTVPEPVSTIKPKSTKTTAKVEETKKETARKNEDAESDNIGKSEETVKVENKTTPKAKTTPTKSTAKKTTAAKTQKSAPVKTKNTQAEELAKALETIQLVVEFKDGGKIERPMNEVVRFGVDKGILTIIHKDGSIGKYSILEITKISVQ